MSGLFDFLTELPPYDDNETTIYRLNQRHKLIIDPFGPQIEGARVLDIAAHDGRWSYALAAAGAAEVVGVEARPELVARFDAFPETDFKPRVSLTCGDLFDDLEARGAAGERFDVVALYGIFYHVMDHFRLLSLIRALEPGLVMIDSEFIVQDNAMIQVLKEDVSNPLNAVTEVEGRSHTVVGVPSRRATEFMAEALNLDCVWIDHDLILGEDRRGMHDYFRDGRKVRHVCALSPAGRG
ncbi:tRNA (mo5U34)-methyltransferase [Roseovarius sp. THAF27]|uniref:methyltransferase domain-containing protein n=1 Tax=Roseovarius sp. THAF27 TaxID=2587850 RepID=UPI0012697899|nr:methyltransferase domain-containing protein [Roseovarius sp. THAF27]QFT79855.1 tRNA (mo5U34)-methyltransferase [Roseovarius sp. THAF27]